MLHRGEEDKSDCAIGVVVSAGIVRTDTKKKRASNHIQMYRWDTRSRGLWMTIFFPPENEKKKVRKIDVSCLHLNLSTFKNESLLLAPAVNT